MRSRWYWSPSGLSALCFNSSEITTLRTRFDCSFESKSVTSRTPSATVAPISLRLDLFALCIDLNNFTVLLDLGLLISSHEAPLCMWWPIDEIDVLTRKQMGTKLEAPSELRDDTATVNKDRAGNIKLRVAFLLIAILVLSWRRCSSLFFSGA